MSKLTGYRTYIIAALLGLAAAARSLNYIDADVYGTILSILVPSGLYSAAVHKP